MAQANAVPVSGSKLDNRRVLAALIDLVVVGAGWGVILAAAGMLGEGPSELGAPLVGVMLAWALYYYFACESGSGQTLGKRVTNIRVVRVDGGAAGMREIALRTVLRLIDMQFFYLVGLIVMLGTRERRGRLGDLVAGTMVVSADQPASESVATAAPAAETSRVPIAESGPAFAPNVVEEPAAADDSAAEGESADLSSPALQELASDVAATAGSAPDEVEEPAVEVLDDQPFAEDEPAAEEPAAEEPAEDESAADEPAADEPAADEEPAVEQEPAAEQETAQVEAVEDESASEQDADEVTVRPVETVSAIDLVMDDSRRNS